MVQDEKRSQRFRKRRAIGLPRNGIKSTVKIRTLCNRLLE
jgi:hypothetical protein